MTTHESICQNARPLMTAYQTDLEHDGRWIEENPGREFIHITRRSGTHIYGLPRTEPLVRDEPRPYLFGVARPSDIYRQVSALLRGSMIESGVLWQHFDGVKVHKRSAERCQQIYDQQLRRARTAAIHGARSVPTCVAASRT